jgi:hypothetical protein
VPHNGCQKPKKTASNVMHWDTSQKVGIWHFWYSFGPPGKFVFLKYWKTWQKSNKFQNVFLFRMIRTSSKFFEQKFEHFLKKSSNKVRTKFE